MSLRQFLVLAVLPLAASGAADELKILRVTPAGTDVVHGQEIVISFDRKVVPLGRMERDAGEIPVSITPKVACQWRWLDPSALACRLDKSAELDPATRYVVRIEPKFVTEDGERMREGMTHEFVTQRPLAISAEIDNWTAPGSPVIRLALNQDVHEDSLAASLDIGGQGVKVERDRLWTDAHVWLVQPLKPLPGSTSYKLSIKPGLRPMRGTEPGTEQRTLLEFKTFGPFQFLGISCVDSKDPALKRVTYAPERVRFAACDPQARTEMLFSVPPPVESIKAAFALTPDPAGHLKDYEPWDNYGYELPRGGTVEERYPLRLPYTLKPMMTYRLQFAGTLKDMFGRELKIPVDVPLPTGHRAAAAVLTHTVSVLEQGVDSEVPMIAANLDQLKAQYTQLTANGRQEKQTHEIALQPLKDIGYTMPLDVRGMLGGKSGAVQGRIETDPRPLHPRKGEEEGEEQSYDFFAEVTPWQVHAKLGHYNALVWVTEFATGKPVVGAQVQISPQDRLTFEASAAPVETRTDDQGIAQLPGTAQLDPLLAHHGWKPGQPLAVSVRKGEDIALLPLTEDFSVDTYRASHYQIWSQSRQRYGHLKSWGTTAQGVYRAGDRVQYKIYVREDQNLGLAPPPRGLYQLQVRDPQDQLVHERKHVALSTFGALDGKFTVAKTGAVGWYRFLLTPEFDSSAPPEKLGEAAAKAAEEKPSTGGKPKRARKHQDEAAGLTGEELQPMRVLVSDFTPAPFKVATQVHAERAVAGEKIQALTRATLYAGGPYTQANGRLAARVVQAGELKPKSPQWQDFSFNNRIGCEGYSRGAEPAGEEAAALDAQGELAHDFTVYQSNDIAYGRYLMEGSAKDDRGRSVANTATLPYFGRDRFVGLRYKGWMLEQRKPASIETLVLDPSGAPAAGTKVTVQVEYEDVTAARVQDAGNAYVMRYSSEWQTVKTCELVSGSAPIACTFTPKKPGSYRVRASTTDTKEREHESCDWLYAAGQGEFVWQQKDDYGLDLVPEKTDFKVGEHARLLVKNPYPGAQALVTVERYGAIDHWVQTLVGNTPVIDIPVKPDYLPGFYVSVVVQSPRVQAPPPQGDVDLGKPAFRMGYARFTVTDPYKELQVHVKPQRERYQPREHVRVQVQASPRHGVKGEPVELAVAVVDESVFDLIQGGMSYFDPAGLRSLDALDLANYSLLTRLVGRQKFEKKGATPGGDGGADLAMRSVDKYLAYWNPSVRAGEDGSAKFEFDLPDNLTAWKILVLGTTVSDRLGLGSASVKVSKDTEIRPVMPNQVTGGDRFTAAVSVMNRAQATRTLAVKLQARGAAQGEHQESITLKGFERRVVSFELAAQSDAANGAGRIDITASAGDAADRDVLKLTLPVRARRPTVTAASYGSLTSGTVQEKFAIPTDILPGGGIGVSLTPSLLGAMDGAFRYARDYPYLCWEQRLSKAIMAAHYLRLKSYLSPDFTWPEAAGLPRQLFEDAAGFQGPDGGFGYWDGAAAHQDPYLSAFTALGFEWLRAAGYEPPPALQKKLDGYVQKLLREEMPNYTPEAAAAVRATALAALAQRGKLAPADLARFEPMLPRMGLFGQSMYLAAAVRTKGALTQEALNHILSRGQESAGKFVLREADDSFWVWLTGSETRSNCAALSALIATPDPSGALGEVPAKLARSIVQSRKARQDHWYTTQENLFCLAALVDYAQRYEATAPDLTLSALLDSQPLGQAKFSDLRAPAQDFIHPITQADIGRGEVLELRHQGQGRVYYQARISYVEKDESARAANAGIEIHRQYSVQREGQWKELTPPLRVRRGELVRVDLRLNLPSQRHFVAVDDPVPGGLETVNTDLATASGYDAQEDRADSARWQGYPYPFYHRELRHESAQFFADFAAEGSYHLRWIGQAIAVGQFTVGAPHVEEMYDPDVFGNDVPVQLIVEEGNAK